MLNDIPDQLLQTIPQTDLYHTDEHLSSFSVTLCLISVITEQYYVWL